MSTMLEKKKHNGRPDTQRLTAICCILLVSFTPSPCNSFTTPIPQRANVHPTILPKRNPCSPVRPSRHFMSHSHRMATTSTTPKSNPTTPLSPSKLRKLKDRMWVRETLEDVTAAEFASTLSPLSSTEVASSSRKQRKKRAVDYENVLQKLNRRIEEMCVLTEDEECGLDEITTSDGSSEDEIEKCFRLVDGTGMGSVVYTNEQREALLRRIITSREKIVNVMNGENDTYVSPNEYDVLGLDDIRRRLQDTILLEKDEDQDLIKTANIETNMDNSMNASGLDPSVYIREDGSVDWDGALQDQAALKLFGTAVWARINGLDPANVDENAIENGQAADAEIENEGKKVKAQIIETEALRAMKNTLDELKTGFQLMESEHTRLLTSAIDAGSTTSTINLASLSPSLRNQIRNSSDSLQSQKDDISFANLNYDLERIFTYLESEMGNTYIKGYISLQDRLYVAEFGLLESQIDQINKLNFEGEFIDNDVLAVIVEQLTDFKRRLGIDYYVSTEFTFDSEAIKLKTQELLDSAKRGLAFYTKGCQLLYNDILFSFRLLTKAAGQGYTLKPREVKTLRRTTKDFFTFIPFLIILITPLTPVGHVLIFGAIQRFFPGFFPSCFTERRQNLLQLYESTEYREVVVDETWKQKIVRFSEAAGYLFSASWRKAFQNIKDRDSDSSS